MQWKRVRNGIFFVSVGLLMAGLLYPSRVVAETVFTNDTTIVVGNTDYEGSNIVVRGCTLTVEGEHVFAGLTVTNAGVVTTDTNLNLTSLTLYGSTFTLAGGAELSVSNAVTLRNTSTFWAQAVNTSAQVASNWTGVGVTINAENLTPTPGVAGSLPQARAPVVVEREVRERGVAGMAAMGAPIKMASAAAATGPRSPQPIWAPAAQATGVPATGGVAAAQSA